MSARRRQETLEAFCVPVEDTTGEIIDVDSAPVASSSEVQPMRRSVRSSHRSGANAMDSEQDAGAISITDDDGDEFVPQVEVKDDDDGDSTWNQKGKRKAKGKHKSSAQTRFTLEDDLTVLRKPTTNAANPKVMLISLKAGALGLNLTVANNIYL